MRYFANDEQVFPLDCTVGDFRLADLGLVGIKHGSVEVAITGINSVAYGSYYLVVVSLSSKNCTQSTRTI